MERRIYKETYQNSASVSRFLKALRFIGLRRASARFFLSGAAPDLLPRPVAQVFRITDIPVIRFILL